MEVVLADDFTGAAEIAGIAWRGNRSVDLCLGLPESWEAEVMVIDTDTRPLPPGEASSRLADICRFIRRRGVTRVFKKVDSVLRGPVVAEIEGALRGLGRRGALLLSANPSRGRAISNGVYMIEGVPLAETVFAVDPYHPARDSRVRERIGATERIRTPDANTNEDLRKEVSTLTPDLLPVGAGELYEVWSGVEGARPTGAPAGRQLWFGGSRAIRAEREKMFREHGVVVIEGGEPERIEECVSFIVESLTKTEHVAFEIRKDLELDPATVLERMSRIGEEVLSRLSVPVVCVEGGATARSLIDRVAQGPFRVTGEWAPGVVGLRSRGNGSGTEWIVKPGSYPWPEILVRK